MRKALEHEIMLCEQRYEAGIYSDFDVDDDTSSDSGFEMHIASAGPSRLHLRPGLFVGPDGAPDQRVAQLERCFWAGSALQALSQLDGNVGAQASGLLEPTAAPSSSAPRQPGAWDTIVADA